MTRTDVHSPSNLVTEDYTYLRVLDLRPDEDDRQALEELSNFVAAVRSGGGFAEVHPWGQCDHCGAWFRYAAFLRHDPTGQVVQIGQDCLGNRFSLATPEFKAVMARAAETRAQQERKKAATAAIAELPEAIRPLLARLPEGLEGFDIEAWEHHIVCDIRNRLWTWGNISEKQVALIAKIRRDIEERATRKAEEEASATPVIEGATTIEGVILSTKLTPGYSYYSPSVLKMLVRDDRGFKVWGTVPRSIKDKAERGVRVSFKATVQKSDDDPYFGFFKRPSEAVAYSDSAGSSLDEG